VEIEVVTVFPEMIESYTRQSVLGRARQEGLLNLVISDLRGYSADARRSVDDTPFGGGPGMLLGPEPFFRWASQGEHPRPTVLLSPSGREFRQADAKRYGAGGALTLLCGRYEGVDARVEEALCDEVVSVGDFVLAGGELAALCVIEAVTRLVPGVLGNEASSQDESFALGLLEYPQYTRPRKVQGRKVPEVLLSGDHGLIKEWRSVQQLVRTLRFRPDLIELRGGLSEQEVALLMANGYANLVEKASEEQESHEPH
jgi:tRNA (guanine37-N1)-methyltransferase